MIVDKLNDGSLRQEPAAAGPRAMIVSARERNRRAFFALVSRHLKALHHFVRHELRYLEAVGDLTPGTVTSDDVVDAVLLDAHRQFVKHPPDEWLGGWLVRLAREHLDSEVKRFASERRRMPTHIEDDVPETPPAEAVSTLGDEILDFYEPDEDLKVEDIIPDLDAQSPEEEAERSELRQCVDMALAGLPREWRRALLLRYAEGLMGPPSPRRCAGRPPRPSASSTTRGPFSASIWWSRAVASKKARHGHERHRDDSLPRVRRRQPTAGSED
jgi:RNA polymerase sigma factor (sigma-70 family)